ncbi:hypothetical protein BASA60_003111 [Batrachochytrium salamandrivorans]|nr:hypothetical protein BASA60_003111 [Batrachochytrium salamandrivorans]
MKLISFAIVSLLAITVSAQPPQDPDDQSLEESQGAAFQTTQEPQSATAQILMGNPRQSLRNKLESLTKGYKERQAAAEKLQNDIDKMVREMSGIVPRADGLSGPEKEDLIRTFFVINKSLIVTRAYKRTLEDEWKLS